MKPYIALLTILILTACSSANKEQEQHHSTVTEQTTNPEKTVVDFLVWYRNHPNIQNNLVNNANNETWDSTKFYSVNFVATEKYLQDLKSSGFISDTYITNWRTYFKKCDKNFKENPANDGVPDGFDYDFVTNSQDFEEELKTVEKAKASEIKGDQNKKTILLTFTTGTTRTFELSLRNGNWYIDQIK